MDMKKNNNPCKPYIEVDSNIKWVKEIEEKLKSKSDLVKKTTTITGTNPYMYVIYEILSMSNL